jgi:hypothetical protein
LAEYEGCSVSARPGLSVLEIAAAVGKSPTWVRTLLEEDRARGVLECVDGKWWRLTPKAEKRYGHWLRRVTPL